MGISDYTNGHLVHCGDIEIAQELGIVHFNNFPSFRRTPFHAVIVKGSMALTLMLAMHCPEESFYSLNQIP